MKKIITDKENANAIILNENDNIVIALENMNAGQYLKQFGLKIVNIYEKKPQCIHHNKTKSDSSASAK